MKKTIRTQDGRTLEVKEGVLLDVHNDPVYEQPRFEQTTFNRGKFVIWRTSPLLGLLFIALVPVLVIAGTAIATVVAAIMLIAWTIKKLRSGPPF